MKEVRNSQDLFLHELGDIYDAEQKIDKMLSMVIGEVQNEQIKQAFQEHQQETQQQIQNLERCFEVMGSGKQSTTCHAIEGLEKEHDDFKQSNPSPEIMMMFDIGAAAKTEHYEIASYRGLLDKARVMGQEECARLIEENLQQEEQMAQRVEQLGHQLSEQQIKQGQR